MRIRRETSLLRIRSPSKDSLESLSPSSRTFCQVMPSLSISLRSRLVTSSQIHPRTPSRKSPVKTPLRRNPSRRNQSRRKPPRRSLLENKTRTSRSLHQLMNAEYHRLSRWRHWQPSTIVKKSPRQLRKRSRHKTLKLKTLRHKIWRLKISRLNSQSWTNPSKSN
jgi:hypothetical protein